MDFSTFVFIILILSIFEIGSPSSFKLFSRKFYQSWSMLDDHGLHYYNKYKCKHRDHKCKYKYNVNGLHLELHKWLYKYKLHIYYININVSTHQHTKLKYFDISSYCTSLIVFKGYIFFFKCWYVLNVCKTW